jgi:uncharacterized protein with HEPN domain
MTSCTAQCPQDHTDTRDALPACDGEMRNIEIVGEASYNIRTRHPEFAAAHPELPWGGAYGMPWRMVTTWLTSILSGT